MVTKAHVTVSREDTSCFLLSDLERGTYLVGLSGYDNTAMFVQIQASTNSKRFKLRLIESKYVINGSVVTATGRPELRSKFLSVESQAIHEYFRKTEYTTTVSDLLDLFEIILNDRITIPLMKWVAHW